VSLIGREAAEVFDRAAAALLASDRGDCQPAAEAEDPSLPITEKENPSSE
jgi:hypothetical protein